MAKRVGRPSKYTPELVTEICERLSKGEPLAQICREEDMPSVTTMWRWVEGISEVSESIARAREEGEDVMAADCLKIADDSGFDAIMNEGGKIIVNSEAIQRAKLRIDTRLKLLSKWNPKKYGEKLDIEHKGEVTTNFKWGG